MCATFLDEVTVGSGRYAQTCIRRPGELVVHCRAEATDADMNGLMTPPDDEPLHEDEPLLAPLRTARKLWARFGSVPDALLRTHAEDLQGNPLVKAATPVYEMPGGGVYATPMPGEMVIRIATGSEADVEAALAARLERVPRASEFLPARDHLFRVRDVDHPETGFDLMEGVVTPGRDGGGARLDGARGLPGEVSPERQPERSGLQGRAPLEPQGDPDGRRRSPLQREAGRPRCG